MPTGALRITQELVAKRFFSQAPASKAEVTCRQQSWPWRSYSRSPLQRSAFCAGRATFRGPVQSSVRSAWWRETPAPTTGTEITEGMPSEGHYCGHLTQEESKLHGERRSPTPVVCPPSQVTESPSLNSFPVPRFNSPSPRGPVTTTDVFTSYFPDSSAAMIRFAAQTTCLLLLASQINFKQN
ncbi:pro-neuregulin-4, membrane-bound isoform isoform X1 [Alexandromys fortis]|uniref:pro-neuregulin-4, membrane-bound isoform isoform X1 n=1 Tax=Alexandromys fortis TaxID=100897 RepID=UPI0021530159|nr:pro-neuregulin-4, membrane-bound isoform isoform X1 [Microtus fortis]XP_049975430.1 pro-neuregulin-4, membrane-bound isoform isoform X1 [Microtus fortis]